MRMKKKKEIHNRSEEATRLNIERLGNEREKKKSHTCSVRSRAMVGRRGDDGKKNEPANQRAVGKFESELFAFVSVACR